MADIGADIGLNGIDERIDRRSAAAAQLVQHLVDNPAFSVCALAIRVYTADSGI